MSRASAILAKFISNGDLMHRIVHGNDTVEVTTEGGIIPSIAKLFKDKFTGTFTPVVDLASTANLGKGSALVGYDGGTVQDVLDCAKPIANYTALRNYAGRATCVRITQTGLSGFFARDDADATSADNGGTIIVSTNAKRWKRIFSSVAVEAAWFGAKADGTTDDTTALTAASAFAFTNGLALSLPGKAYKLTATLDWTAYANIVVFGSGWASAPTQNVGTQLIQFTNNIPIIRVTARPDIQCLSLRYNTQQTVVQTNAIGIEMNKLSGAYFRNVRVFSANISFGIPQVGFGSDGANFIFNSAFIGVESWQASHTHYDFRSLNGGATNCYFGPLYINGMGSLDFATTGQSCEYGIRATNCTGFHFTAVSIDGLTFNQTLVDLVNNCKAVFTTLRFESVRTMLNGGYWINMGGSHAQLDIGLLELYRIRSQASDGVNTTTIIRTNATDFNINVDQVRVAIAEVTTGSKRFFRAGGTSEESEFNNSEFLDTDGIFPTPWSDDTGRTVTPIRTFDGKRISERNGNAAGGTTSGRTVFLQTNQAPGSTGWSGAGGMGTKPWLAGDRIIVQDAGDLGRVLEWRCYASGTPGSWAPAVFAGGHGAMNFPGDADSTFTPLVSRGNLHYSTTLTANRTITLDTTNAWNGLRVLVTRTAAGNFTLSVGGLATLNTGDWCEVGYDGGSYRVLRTGLISFTQVGTGALSRLTSAELRTNIRLDQYDTPDNARAQQKIASLANVYDTTVGGVAVRTDSRGFFEHVKDIAAVAGRHAITMLRTTWKGDGQFLPGASGANSSSNTSAISLSQVHYGGGNSEPIQSLSRSYGSAAQGGFIQDLASYAGTGQYGGEWVLRDGEIVATATISSITANTLVLATSATSQYFGAGINTRSAIKRGRPLLNSTRKIALASASLSGSQVTVPSTTGMSPGDYFGFDADTQAVTIGTARHLSRILTVDDATHITLDNVYEAAGYTHAYQGASTTGVATVFPCTLASSYDPDIRTFSFNAALGAALDSRFQAGDAVVQYPATDSTSVGLQVDLNCRINQKNPRDMGFVAVSLGRQALAAFFAIGDSALTYAFKYGVYLQNVSIGRFFSGFPEKETDNVNGVKNWHRNSAPSVLAADGAKGSVFQRQNGGVDKTLYVKIIDASGGGDATQGWAPVQSLQETGWNAASMPTVTTLGFNAFVVELNHSAEWDGSKWVNGGYRCVGTAAQKPTGIWPGYRYYETDTPGLKTWNGTAWA